jgi:mannose-6-phosphate isomerase-like protein (cupin superfamily)
MNELTSRVIQVASGQTGRSFWGPGDMYTFLVTGDESGGSMFALDCVVGSGGGPPPHKHLAEDELFAITSGSITFTAGSNTRTVSAGESVFVPRSTRHSYRNEDPTPARMIAVYTPAGMEGWFPEVCTPVEDPGAAPPPVTDELIRRMLDAGHGTTSSGSTEVSPPGVAVARPPAGAEPSLPLQVATIRTRGRHEWAVA